MKVRIMKPTLAFAVAISILSLGGCESIRIENERIWAEQAREDAAIAQRDKAREQQYFSGLVASCQNYGFEIGTAAMANCIQRLDMQNKAEVLQRKNCERARYAASMKPTRTGRFGEGLANGEEAYTRCMSGGGGY